MPQYPNYFGQAALRPEADIPRTLDQVADIYFQKQTLDELRRRRQAEEQKMAQEQAAQSLELGFPLSAATPDALARVQGAPGTTPQASGPWDGPLADYLSRRKQKQDLEGRKSEAEIAKLNASQKTGGLEPSQSATIEGKLYDDFIKSKTVTDFNMVRDSLRNVARLSSQQGGIFDVGLLYSFIKALDPGSAVREGEISLSQSAVPGLDRVALLYGKLTKGQVTPEFVNKQIRSAIADFYDEKKKGVAPEREAVLRRASRFGVPADFLPDIEIPEAELAQIRQNFATQGKQQQGQPAKVTEKPKKSPEQRYNELEAQGISESEIYRRMASEGY